MEIGEKNFPPREAMSSLCPPAISTKFTIITEKKLFLLDGF